jgi:predicted small secreted protein
MVLMSASLVRVLAAGLLDVLGGAFDKDAKARTPKRRKGRIDLISLKMSLCLRACVHVWEGVGEDIKEVGREEIEAANYAERRGS